MTAPYFTIHGVVLFALIWRVIRLQREVDRLDSAAAADYVSQPLCLVAVA